MNPNTTISYELAQARIADLRHQARREGLVRAAARSTQLQTGRRPGSPPLPAQSTAASAAARSPVP